MHETYFNTFNCMSAVPLEKDRARVIYINQTNCCVYYTQLCWQHLHVGNEYLVSLIIIVSRVYTIGLVLIILYSKGIRILGSESELYF